MKRLYIVQFLILIAFCGCKNDDFDYGIRPEGLRDFTLKSPKTESTILLNSGTPDESLVLEWNASKSGLGSEVTYQWLAIKPEGSFDAPLITLPADNSGKDPKLTISQKSLDNALAAAGVTNGSETVLNWSVKATNPTFEKVAPVPFKIVVKRFAEGISAFNLSSPADNTELILDEDKLNEKIEIKWDAPQLVNTTTVKYQWLAILNGGNFDTPLLSYDSDESGTLPKLSITQKALDDKLAELGYKRVEKVNLQWTIRATSGSIVKPASDTMNLSIVRFGTVKFPPQMFLMGGSTSAGWSPENGIPFVKLGDGKFESYAYLTISGDGFKFLPTNKGYEGDWGKSKTEADKLEQNDEANVTVPKDGFYRVYLDFTTKTFSVEKVSWGIIGSAAPGDWSGPDTDMSYDAASKTLKATLNLIVGEIKFRANDDWPINYGDIGVDDGVLDFNSNGDGSNISISEEGKYEVSLLFNSNGQYTYTLKKI